MYFTAGKNPVIGIAKNGTYLKYFMYFVSWGAKEPPEALEEKEML